MSNGRPLTAQALLITTAEYDALVEVRDRLANGDFVHDPNLALASPNGFNMNVPEDTSECGTSCCIGGWMHHVMMRDRTAPCVQLGEYVNKRRSRTLTPLFFPFVDPNDHSQHVTDDYGAFYDFPWDQIDTGPAVKAIDNFLSTGDPDWPAALGIEQLEVHPNA